MTMTQLPQLDPSLDLVLQRTIDVPAHLCWEAWTQPEHLKQWFVPKPWQVIDCQIDLRPGGLFRVTQRGPAGEELTYTCAYLEVVPNERLVWTDALGPGYRPNKGPFLGEEVGHFTAIVTFEALGKQTRYTARAMHGKPDGRNKHEEYGFTDGWGTSLDQMVAYIKGRQGK